MSTKDRTLPIDALTTPQGESTDPDYLAWRDAEVQAALKEADENPDDALTQQEMWNKFGLDR